MFDNNVSSELLQPSLPGEWIVEHRRIWQIDFLSADKLARFSHERSLGFSNEKEVIQLWQLGLLKADIITSHRKLRLVGLVDRGIDRKGNRVYSDERSLPRRLRNWENARKNLKQLPRDIELLFHPFRYYVLYHLDRVLKLHVSKTQMLYQEGLHDVLNWNLSSFNRWSTSDEFISCIRNWNDITSLIILTEPCTYERIFHSIKYSSSEVANHQTGAEEIRQHMIDYWQNNLKKLYHHVGIERLEGIRQDLCFETQRLDQNRWIHTLLCLGDSKLRLELEDHLGGALLLRTMAEMMRRATEEAFEKELREEDELGAGWVPQGVKKTLYGSNRILDDQQAGSVFTSRHDLNYKPRIHLYVEGQTEYGAINSFFKLMGISVPITNLRGLIREGNSMVKYFADSLLSDSRDHTYSIVIIDGDVRENVRILESAARRNNISQYDGIFGRFFLAKPDFEFENFEIEELEEVLWIWLGEESEENPSLEERQLLHNYVKDTTGSAAFMNGVKRFAALSFPRLVGYEKGEEWGEKLMEYALKHRFKRNRKRQLIECIDLALFWEKTIQLERYDEAIARYTVNFLTGELIERTKAN